MARVSLEEYEEFKEALDKSLAEARIQGRKEALRGTANGIYQGLASGQHVPAARDTLLRLADTLMEMAANE